MEPDPAVVRNLLSAVERRDEAARAYSTAMEELAEALRAAHTAGGPPRLLAEVSRLSRPTSIASCAPGEPAMSALRWERRRAP